MEEEKEATRRLKGELALKELLEVEENYVADLQAFSEVFLGRIATVTYKFAANVTKLGLSLSQVFHVTCCATFHTMRHTMRDTLQSRRSPYQASDRAGCRDGGDARRARRSR